MERPITLGCSRIGTSTRCDMRNGFSLYMSAYFCSLDGIRPVDCTFSISVRGIIHVK